MSNVRYTLITEVNDTVVYRTTSLTLRALLNALEKAETAVAKAKPMKT